MFSYPTPSTKGAYYLDRVKEGESGLQPPSLSDVTSERGRKRAVDYEWRNLAIPIKNRALPPSEHESQERSIYTFAGYPHSW